MRTIRHEKYLIATVAVLLGGSAHAADAVVYEAPVVESFSWTGFYFGVHAGYAFAEGDFESAATEFATFPGRYVSETDLDGLLVGAHAGAQYQMTNNLVLGAEVDIDYRDAEDRASIVFVGAPVDVLSGFDLNTEINWTASARLRLGYAIDRWLPYVTGGLAVADTESGIYSEDILLEQAGTDFSDTSYGWTLGAGVEYAFTDNVLLRAEYRYSDFGEIDAPFFLTPGLGDAELSLTSHDVMLGVSYKF